MSELTHRFDCALVYASGIHRRQRRKGTNIPYISHLLGVASLVLEHGGTEDQAIAALLHDAAEDQGGEQRLDDIRQQFGDPVAEIVSHCTDAWLEPKPPWRQRKEAYLATLQDKPAASLLVSLADKTHNASTIVSDLRVHGEPLWDRFKGGREGSLWYYRSLAAFFEEHLQGELANRLSLLVAEMDSSAGP